MKTVIFIFLTVQAMLSHGAPEPKTIIEFANYDGPVYVHTTSNSPADDCFFKNTPKTPLLFNQESDCTCKPTNPSPEPLKPFEIIKNLFNTASQTTCNNNLVGKHCPKDIKCFTGRNSLTGKSGPVCNSNLANYLPTDVDKSTGVNNPTGINTTTDQNISTGINNPVGTNYPQTGICYPETVFVPKSLSYSRVVNSAGDTISMTYDNLHGCKCHCAKQC